MAGDGARGWMYFHGLSSRMRTHSIGVQSLSMVGNSEDIGEDGVKHPLITVTKEFPWVERIPRSID